MASANLHATEHKALAMTTPAIDDHSQPLRKHTRTHNMPDAAAPITETPARSGLTRMSMRDGGAWLTLALTALLTLGFWQSSTHHFARHTHDRFMYRAEKEKNILASRIQAYGQVLRGAAALFAASEQVSRAEWRTYVETLHLDESLPGIQGTGFVLMIRARDKAEHEHSVRAEGFPAYAIHPPGERDPYSSIVYLEPFSGRNLRAFGYDMYSEPVRRDVMERARDTGELSLSSKITLVQETESDVQPGFLMYLPIYRNGMARGSVAERRAALLGFVYSPFRAHDLMRGVFGDSNQDIEIELFDSEPLPENLLFASIRPGRQANHTAELPLEFGGHKWIARIHSSPAFEVSAISHEPLLILLGGLALNLMLFAVILNGARHRRRMQAAAARLEQSRDRFRTLVENVPGTVFRIEAHAPWKALHVSAGIEALTGEPHEHFLSGRTDRRKLIHPDDTKAVDEALTQAVAERTTYNVEYRVRTTDGQTRWASERGRASYGANGTPQWVDGVILDITDRKIAELAIRDLAYYDPLTALPNRRLLLDRLHQQLAVSARSGLHGALLFVDLDKFKTINDTLGHHTGDLLLTEVAHRLRSGVREGDTVARLGGDEFIVMLDGLGESADEATHKAVAIGSKLLDGLGQAYRLDGQAVQCTPSIGLTTFCGHNLSADELIRRADEAMYRAKSAGRNRLNVFRVAGA
jgi:diguanylate cyclase (GGDEF)-like protein/PAS domain S-box-containing protein